MKVKVDRIAGRLIIHEQHCEHIVTCILDVLLYHDETCADKLA